MRHVTVAHMVISRLVKAQEQFLFWPHGRWHKSGRPMLAALTKKVPPGPSQVEPTLAVLEKEGFDGSPPPLREKRPLLPFRITLESPSQKRLTRYKVFPVLARYGRGRHESRIEQRGALWLTRTEALGHGLLSPTARRALAQVRRNPSGPLGPQAYEGTWTERLVYARDHDQRAFGPLFEEMTGWLRARLLASFASPVDIDDVIAETAVFGLAYLPTFRGEFTAQAWLTRICCNAMINQLRQRRSRRLVNLDSNEAIEQMIDPEPGPLARLQSGEQYQEGISKVQEVLQSLPRVQQMAWHLRFEENMELAEIGEALDKPHNTVATWLHRAKRKMARG